MVIVMNSVEVMTKHSEPATLQNFQEYKCLERDRIWRVDLIMFDGHLHRTKTPLRRLRYLCEYCSLIKGAEDLPVSLPVYKKIIAEAERLGIKDSTAVMAIVDLLFTENILTQLSKYRHLCLCVQYLLIKLNCFIVKDGCTPGIHILRERSINPCISV